MSYFNYSKKLKSPLSFGDNFKGIDLKFNINSEEIYKNDVSKFKEELDNYISGYGFENTYVDFIDDGFISEIIFYIKTPKNKSFKELMPYLKNIISHMESFSKYNNLQSLFMDSYIMFD